MVIGSTISHYRIVEKLGEGGMGVVYKAEDTQLRRTVALKFLPRESLDEEEVKARLIREAQAAAGLDHSNICQVFGIHEEDGETFIAMAYIDGPSLAEKIKERPLPPGGSSRPRHSDSPKRSTKLMNTESSLRKRLRPSRSGVMGGEKNRLPPIIRSARAAASPRSVLQPFGPSLLLSPARLAADPGSSSSHRPKALSQLR